MFDAWHVAWLLVALPAIISGWVATQDADSVEIERGDDVTGGGDLTPETDPVIPICAKCKHWARSDLATAAIRLSIKQTSRLRKSGEWLGA